MNTQSIERHQRARALKGEQGASKEVVHACSIIEDMNCKLESLLKIKQEIEAGTWSPKLKDEAETVLNAPVAKE